MRALEGLKPEKVFYFFEEICQIPHGTYNTKQISDYCKHFAEERGLRVLQDSANNIIIWKPGSAGYENCEPVILQGHIDMVCEKTIDSTHDFATDPLELYVEDGFVKARNTTLGGDDGIGVAMALAILDSDSICHPPLEVVLTSEEESGMDGALALDMSPLKGKRLINIDSEEEGFLTVGCAGGCRFDTTLSVDREEQKGLVLEIGISGLLGGHSGIEIYRQRGNGHKMMGRLLYEISESVNLRLISVGGGSKDNVISRECTAHIMISENMEQKCMEIGEQMLQVWKNEFGSDEPELSLEIKNEGVSAESVFTETSTKQVITYLFGMPDGIMCYSRNLPGQVETSLNAGSVTTNENTVIIAHLIRSEIDTKKWAVVKQLSALAELAGGTGKPRSSYPAWSYRKDSNLRSVMVSVYREFYGKEPEILTIHGGLECGLFLGKKPELDCVSFGPDVIDVHSVTERLDIASVERSYEYLLKVLEACR
ncbi:aminoacyl-histidine dipeptidase [Sporofaciens sp. SGI.106]|uniref:aminoacyl-histidine dipeptidase n=1 Tax=Sporofaciens sp. SGI.106 TaxID=3420568 RepID=UPI002AA01182|nr:aminoacyl-histidine dipeptidase [Lachnoclostridium sp.]